MNDTITSSPKLIEPGVIYFFNKTLQNYKNFKERNYFLVSNAIMFLIIVILSCIILFFKYRGKKTIAQQQRKNQKYNEQLIEKIKIYQRQKYNDPSFIF